jgi:hypothetical protein
MAKYYVYGNLNHDNESYERGDTIDLEGDVALHLSSSGVVGKEKAEKAPVPAPQPAQEPEAEPEVGGAPTQSGEPSVDTQEAESAATEAVDVTPQVSERMTREELEGIARQEGISDETIELASTKKAVVELIEHARADKGVDPSANL